MAVKKVLLCFSSLSLSHKIWSKIRSCVPSAVLRWHSDHSKERSKRQRERKRERESGERKSFSRSERRIKGLYNKACVCVCFTLYKRERNFLPFSERTKSFIITSASSCLRWETTRTLRVQRRRCPRKPTQKRTTLSIAEDEDNSWKNGFPVLKVERKQKQCQSRQL